MKRTAKTGPRRVVIDDSSLQSEFLDASDEQVRAHLGVAPLDPENSADAKTAREIEELLAAVERDEGSSLGSGSTTAL